MWNYNGKKGWNENVFVFFFLWNDLLTSPLHIDGRERAGRPVGMTHRKRYLQVFKRYIIGYFRNNKIISYNKIILLGMKRGKFF